jgi:hypothetical protein
MAKKEKKVTIGKGMKVTRSQEKKMEKRPGSSNVGRYKNVKKKDFAGPAGGSPQGSFPIPNLKKAKSALKLAHNAPNPEGIKKKVYSKYPQLKKGKKHGKKK